jgi:hypothetical protein
MYTYGPRPMIVDSASQVEMRYKAVGCSSKSPSSVQKEVENLLCEYIKRNQQAMLSRD